MDKPLAFLVIGLLAICAGIVTYGVFDIQKRSLSHRIWAYIYVAFTWACVIALTVLTIIYKDM